MTNCQAFRQSKEMIHYCPEPFQAFFLIFHLFLNGILVGWSEVVTKLAVAPERRPCGRHTQSHTVPPKSLLMTAAYSALFSLLSIIPLSTAAPKSHGTSHLLNSSNTTTNQTGSAQFTGYTQDSIDHLPAYLFKRITSSMLSLLSSPLSLWKPCLYIQS